MEIDVVELESMILQREKGMDRQYAKEYAERIIREIDPRLVPNLIEWMGGKAISDIWIGKYCINAIMSIRGNQDFLSALDAMIVYCTDEEKGKMLIWRGKK